MWPEGIENDYGKAYGSYAKPDIGEIGVVTLHLREKAVDRHVFAEPVAERCEHAVPHGSAERCVDTEASDVHPREAGGNGDKLPYCRDKTSDESRYGSVAVKIGFGFVNFGPVNQAGVPQPRVSEPIDKRAPYPHGEPIIDKGTDKGAGCGNDYDEPYIEVGHCDFMPLVSESTHTLGCKESGWRDDDFARKRYEGAFDSHEEENEQIGCVFHYPFENGGCVNSSKKGYQTVCQRNVMLRLEVREYRPMKIAGHRIQLSLPAGGDRRVKSRASATV